MNFREKLIAAQHKNHSWLCIGLDPDPDLMPDEFKRQGPAGMALFCQAIIKVTLDIACAFKPNLAFFLAHGSTGISALEDTLKSIPSHIPVILDAKVGDIGSTQRHYGQAAFGLWRVDAMTISPYVGEDAVKPLLESFPDCGLYVLCRSSNPDSPRFQKYSGAEPALYEQVARTTLEWQQSFPRSTLGLVAGATQPEDITQLRAIAPNLPFLIPGVGVQGGSLDAAVEWGMSTDGIGPLINASRAILYASHGPDYADTARSAAQNLRDEINDLRAAGGNHD